MSIYEKIQNAVMTGQASEVEEYAQQAINEGKDPEVIINEGFIAGMRILGVKFKNNEVYVPEVLIAARAMHAGMDVVKPLLAETSVEGRGVVLIGTVKSDLHDIGKNIVVMMLEGAGFKVIDLGIDVPTEKFLEAVKEFNPKVVGISALLTTTMTQMKETVGELKAAFSGIKIIIGGAPVSQEFADKIGADAYAPDAASAAEKVGELVA